MLVNILRRSDGQTASAWNVARSVSRLRTRLSWDRLQTYVCRHSRTPIRHAMAAYLEGKG
eukprot:scaffold162125_cov78-Attheya_sp.AAC.6